MKKIILSLLFVFSIITASAANVEKIYTKTIENFDVATEAKYIDSVNPAEFWSTAINKNELYNQFKKDIQKNKGAEKDAINNTAQLPRFYPQYEETIVESKQGFCDSLLLAMGIRDLNIPCSLYVVTSDNANSFTALTDDGFAICMTTGLLSKKGVNTDILKGYVAHEFVHGAFLHHIRTYYAAAKSERKNTVVGCITAGLVIGMASFVDSDYNVVITEIDKSSVINIGSEVEKPFSKYSFDYLSDQVFEADLIAYRFLEHLGCGDEYINGLKILGTSYDELYTKFSYHPKIEARINFLKYVQQHPELGNTKNMEMLQKRIRREAWNNR